MRVLWIINIPIGKLCEMANTLPTSGGSWLRVAHDAFLGDNEVEIAIATTWNCDNILHQQDQNITYFLMPGGKPFVYDQDKKENLLNWEYIKNEYKPDGIIVWGTEFTHGLAALRTMKDIPSAVYIQGVVANIAKHYFSGLTTKKLIKSITLRDILKNDMIFTQKKKYQKQAVLEAEILTISNHVIVENIWCESQCKIISPNCKTFFSKLPIDKIFFEHAWHMDKITKFSIMCNAGYYPIKGLHVLLKALSLVKKKYPDVELRIPGMLKPNVSKLLNRAKSNGYATVIADMISEYGLDKNVNFLGALSSQEMAREMSECNLFVMPSCVENHSSTLIEAMIVGTPCISTCVGGVPEILEHMNTGMLYRYDEWEVLAVYIDKIFSDTDFATHIGKTARTKMIAQRMSSNIKEELNFVHKDLCFS